MCGIIVFVCAVPSCKITKTEGIMKYSTWLNLWLENYVKPSNKTRTYLRYRQIATTHIARYLGEQEIDDITPLELQQYVSKLLIAEI